MRIIIAGASGLIGRALTEHLTARGHYVCALSRYPEKMKRKVPESEHRIWRRWRADDIEDWQSELESCDVVINLMGAPVLGGRWTKKRKEILYRSRVDTGKILSAAVVKYRPELKVFLQASAIGYYDIAQPQPVDEQGRAGDSFLARLTREWERSVDGLEDENIPVYRLRLGMVLSRESLVVRLMRPAFLMFKGGPVGSGRQMVSWIHIDDVRAIVDYLIARPQDGCVVNLTAPESVTMKAFARAFGQAIKRPSWLKIPAFVLKGLMGEMAGETMLSGIAVYPRKLLDMGYRFQYRQIEAAFGNILSPEKSG